MLSIERDYEPVAVSDGERDYWRESTVQMIRFTVPDWTWDGPRIPDHKPVFTELLTGRAGRIWVRLSTAGQRVENEDYEPGESLLGARHLAGIDTLRRLRARWHLSGCRRTAG